MNFAPSNWGSFVVTLKIDCVHGYIPIQFSNYDDHVKNSRIRFRPVFCHFFLQHENAAEHFILLEVGFSHFNFPLPTIVFLKDDYLSGADFRVFIFCREMMQKSSVETFQLYRTCYFRMFSWVNSPLLSFQLRENTICVERLVLL